MLINPPGPGFSYCIENLSATPDANGQAFGTAFNSGSSNGEASAAAVLSALAFDCLYLQISAWLPATASQDNSALMRVLIDRSGGSSWSSFIDYLIVGFGSATLAGGIAGHTVNYHFPIWMPAGATFAVICRRTGAGAGNGRVLMRAFGLPRRPDMWWAGQGVESLGIDAANSKGTVLGVPSGSYSSVYAMGTSTRRYGAVQFEFQPSTNAVQAYGYYLQVGTYLSDLVTFSQLGGSPTQYYTENANEQTIRVDPGGPIFCDIPSGIQWGLRAMGSTSGINHNGAVYGVY